MYPKSMYIHIPFCKNICKYCDFCKMYYQKDWAKNYLYELKNEINKKYKNNKLKTLYIGGGTPSSLSFNELDVLFEKIDKFSFYKNYEFTFECNVEDINEDLLLYLKAKRVNRLSIGIESFNKKILKKLGRKSYKDNYKKILLAKKHFNNINIDLIYGINNQRMYELKKDLKKFIKLGINHISIYSLILEENTILKKEKYLELSDFLQRKMYDYICKILKTNGFIHYEISNFSKKGYESKHNLCYWDNNEYYGFGLGASGFVNNVRYTNTRSLNNYLKGKYVLDEHTLSEKENMENEMILNLRKLKGINKNSFYKKYNKKIEDVFNVSKLKEKNGFYYISEEDIFLSNSILCDFINI